MEVKLKAGYGILFVEVSQSIDLVHAPILKRYFTKIFASAYRRVIINFTAVEYVDSSGIGALLAITKEAQAKGLVLAFCNIHGTFKKVLELTKLDAYFPVHDSLENAVRLLRVKTKTVSR